MAILYYEDPNHLEHHGIKGQKWHVRRYQNPDGTLTEAGKKRYINSYGNLTPKARRDIDKDVLKALNNKSLFDDMDNALERIQENEKPMTEFLRSKASSKYIDDAKRADMYADMHEGDIKYDSGPYKKYASDNGIDCHKLQRDYVAAHEAYRKSTNEYIESVINEIRGIKVSDIIDPKTRAWSIHDLINSEIAVDALMYDTRRH